MVSWRRASEEPAITARRCVVAEFDERGASHEDRVRLDHLGRLAVSHLELAVSHLLTLYSPEETAAILRCEAEDLEEHG